MGRRVVSLPDRSRQALEYLLRVEQPISMAQIASRLGLSSSQIRYSFRYVEPWLSVRGIRLVKKPRIGIQIEASPDQREALMAELRSLKGYELTLAQEERKQLLLLKMLTTCVPLSSDDLRRQLGVSRTSIFRDLAWVREWLAGRDLHLTSYRHRGLLVEGAELRWREGVVELLLSNLSQGMLVAACVVADPRSIEPGTASQPFLWEASSFLRSLDLHQAERLVTTLEKRLNGTLVDEPRIGLVLYVGLVMLRASMGKFLADRDENGTTPEELHAAREMISQIEEIVGQRLPRAEGLYLAQRIAGAIDMGFIASDPLTLTDDRRVSTAVKLATMLAEEAAAYLHAGLSQDQELIDCLALELSTPTLEWPTGSSQMDHPPQGSDNTAYSLYGFVWRVLRPMLERHGWASPDWLLTALAQHLSTALERLGRVYGRRKVWVICGTRLATARNLVSRLQLRLPELDVVGIASAFELARDPELCSGADAVISTVALDWAITTPLIQVSPLLSPRDIDVLRTSLELEPPQSVSPHSPPPEGLPSMIDILSLQTIKRDVVAGTWEDVVDQAGGLLLQAEAIWPNYVEAMKNMIRMYGPYNVVAPGAALLHAGPEMGAKRLAMSLIVLRDSVPFGHEAHDPVDLALAFSSPDYETHMRAVTEAMQLVSEKRSCRSIVEAGSTEEILAQIKRILG